MYPPSKLYSIQGEEISCACSVSQLVTLLRCLYVKLMNNICHWNIYNCNLQFQGNSILEIFMINNIY